LTGAENLAHTGIRSPDRLARSQSVYRLSYRAHTINEVPEFNPYTSTKTCEGNCVTFEFGYITLLVLGTGEDEKSVVFSFTNNK
jgi:hypothetical protein